MKSETCRTCKHHAEFQTGSELDLETGEEIPIFRHTCDGKLISSSMVKDFRCGRYEEMVR